MMFRFFILLLMAGLLTACAPARPRPLACRPPDMDLVFGAVEDVGGGIRVLEQGFTTRPDAMETDEQFVSYGAVLENVSDKVAARTRMRLRFRDDLGRDITAWTGSDSAAWTEIPAILPGQRIPFGAWRRLNAVDGDGHQVRIAEITVEFGATTWLFPSDDLFKPMDATATALSTGDTRFAATTIHYAATSPYCWNLVHQGMAAVFRDATGTIVGGGLIDIGECRSGQHVGVGSVVGAPEGITAAHTDLYPYCDLTGPATNML